MKNNIRKISIYSAFFISFFGFFCINAKSEGSLRVFYRSNNTSERQNIENENSFSGYSDKCNVLLCEGRKYVNYFFPVPTNRPADSEGGSQCFWEVYQRKMKGNFNANVLRGEAGTWDEQKELLISYVQMAESYLRTMSYFYDDKCVAWREAKKEASARLKSIKENLEEVTEVEILQDKRSLLLHSNIWPCMHTEPICIFDHIDKWYYVLGPPEPKKEDFSLLRLNRQSS